MGPLPVRFYPVAVVSLLASRTFESPWPLLCPDGCGGGVVQRATGENTALGEEGCGGLWGIGVTGLCLLGWGRTISSVVPLAVLAKASSVQGSWRLVVPTIGVPSVEEEGDTLSCAGVVEL